MSHIFNNHFGWFLNDSIFSLMEPRSNICEKADERGPESDDTEEIS